MDMKLIGRIVPSTTNLLIDRLDEAKNARRDLSPESAAYDKAEKEVIDAKVALQGFSDALGAYKEMLAETRTKRRAKSQA